MFTRKYPVLPMASLPDSYSKKIDTLNEEIRMLVSIVINQSTEIEHLKGYVFIDPLSKLYTRKGMEFEMSNIFAGDRRSTSRNAVFKHCVVVFIDLDNFKIINDSQGHEAGDQIIVSVGRILKGSFRSNDICGRWGGDEFIVIIQDIQLHSVKTQIDMVREKLAEIKITASIGVTQLSEPMNRHDEQTFWKKIEESIKKADHGMYIGKKLGKNRIIHC